MAEETKEDIKLEPGVEVEEAGPCKLKVKIEIAADKIGKLVNDRYEKLNQSVAVPGFRRGKTPRTLLERRFGKDLLTELKGDLVDKGFQEAVEAKKLEPITDPNVPDIETLEVKADAAFSYVVEIETMPELKLKSYKGLKVKKPKAKVDKKEVDKAVDEVRDRHATWEPVKGAAKTKDQVIADLEVLKGKESVMKQENTPLLVDSGIHIQGSPLKDFEKEIAGKTVGDTAKYKTSLPKEFPEKSLAGQEVTIQAVLKSVKRKKLPKLDKELFKVFDVDDEEELREELEKRLKKAKEKENKETMFKELLELIIKANEFPLPEGLVERMKQEELSGAAYNLMQQGAPPDQIQKFIEEKREKVDEQTKRGLREQMVIDHIGKSEKIFVTEDEVEAHVKQMSGEMGRPADEIQAEMEQYGMMAGLRRRMRTDKVLDFVLSKAKVEE